MVLSLCPRPNEKRIQGSVDSRQKCNKEDQWSLGDIWKLPWKRWKTKGRFPLSHGTAAAISMNLLDINVALGP
jgi:hypothetical protein